MSDISDLRDPRKYVQSWVAFNGIKVAANGLLIGADLESTFSTLWLDYISETAVYNIRLKQQHEASGHSGPAPKIKRVPKDELEAAWLEYPAKAKKVAQQNLIASILPFNGETTDLKQWLTALMVTEPSELDIAVMKHFIWQIKRRAQNADVVYHICPIFFGKQGGGKTTAIKKLLSPIKEMVIEFNPDEATDGRVKSSFAHNLVCFFDEMANMARVEMEELKKLITADTVTYRPLYTNSFANVQQRCSFIGGSNKSMSELVYDPTGMRRFYEIVCRDKADFNAINNIDYAAIYSSIDGSLERGYLEPFLEELAAHQAHRQTADEVQHFIQEQNLLGGIPKEITAADLYSAFIQWRATAGYAAKQPMVVSSFGMRLSSLKVAKRIKKIDGLQKTVYTVNAESAIFTNRLTPVTMIRGNA